MGNLRSFRRSARQLASLRNSDDLAELLKIDKYRLELLTARANYREFRFPKPKGGYRVIEEPLGPLKNALRALNDHLQAVYWLERSEVAHGYVRWPEDVPGPRNIVTNARAHLGCSTLLNVDLDSFFHQVKIPMVENIFCRHPFRFDSKLTDLVVELTTIHGRLPMGSPTSPALSNLAMRDTDAKLQAWAQSKSICFTRFVDDLTFSSREPQNLDGPEFFGTIESMLGTLGFRINQEKVVHYGMKDHKIVTGLELAADATLPEKFYVELDGDLENLRGSARAFHLAGDGIESRWLKRFRQVVEGRLRFLKMVHGPDDHRYIRALSRFERAVEPPLKEEVLSWLEFQTYD